jgi:hypothetical protein
MCLRILRKTHPQVYKRADTKGYGQETPSQIRPDVSLHSSVELDYCLLTCLQRQ